MANTLLTPTQVTRKALQILHNKLTFVGNVNRQYDSSFGQEGAKIGSQLKIRLPNEYTVGTGRTITPQSTEETSETLTVATQKHVAMDFYSDELALSIDDFSSRIIEPAMAVLAAHVESDALNMYKDVYNQVGTAGTDPNALSIYLNAQRKLNEFLAPADMNRVVLVNSAAISASINAFATYNQDAKAISQQYKEGFITRAAGFNFFNSELVKKHLNGTQDATTPVISGGSQEGSSLVCSGFDALATVTKGSVITIANVNAVHPETKDNYGYVKQFVVTADVTADGAGAATLTIAPPIITSGAKQNVNAGPADGAAITITGTNSVAHAQNLAFHRDAFAFVTAAMPLPKNMDMAAQETYDGINLRFLRGYSIEEDRWISRVDILYGYKAVRPQLACRIFGGV